MEHIFEEYEITKKWVEDAKLQTLETLPKFIKHLLEDYKHDDNTICHALSIGALATTCAMNKSPQGNIKDFQVGKIMWNYMIYWSRYNVPNNNVKLPAKILVYEKMLYPNYQKDFEKTISIDTWIFLQEEAKKKLETKKEDVQCDVIESLKIEQIPSDLISHWKKIIDGEIPFGYTLEDTINNKGN